MMLDATIQVLESRVIELARKCLPSSRTTLWHASFIAVVVDSPLGESYQLYRVGVVVASAGKKGFDLEK